MELKQALKKTWHFLWKDESLLSWIVSLILAFIIVKFIFFPILSLVLATPMPLVVVESGSMHHPGSFIGNALGSQNHFELWWDKRGEWYKNNGVTKQEAENWPFRTGLDRGDIIIVSGRGEIGIGSIIIFEANQKYPIIHRVVDIQKINGKTFYATKGDNNMQQLFSEKSISEDAIIGKATVRIPKLGWVKLAFVRIIEAFT
jgi:signal peptidase I